MIACSGIADQLKLCWSVYSCKENSNIPLVLARTGENILKQFINNHTQCVIQVNKLIINNL